jgi:hypothetical protein
MPRDEEPYTGPIVVIRPVGDQMYEVAIEPPLIGAACATREYPSKCEAFAAAQGLWTKHRLGCRDETVANVGRVQAEHTFSHRAISSSE